MSAWLKTQLAHGALPDGKRLFSEEQAAEMWTPVTPVPITPLPAELKPAQPTQQAYALGWNVQDYRGHRIIQHGGGVFGSITRVVMIPDRQVGFAIMLTSEDSGKLLGLTYYLPDHYLDQPDYGWIKTWETRERGEWGKWGWVRVEVGGDQ